jgi:hypothetical protein
VVREESRFEYVFEIFEPMGSRVYNKKITEDFKYYVNVEKNNIDWLTRSDSFPGATDDVPGDSLVALSFKIKSAVSI